jgi:hypothetical protein
MIKELLNETFCSLRHKSTRSILTGFGVGWGIFMMIPDYTEPLIPDQIEPLIPDEIEPLVKI